MHKRNMKLKRVMAVALCLLWCVMSMTSCARLAGAMDIPDVTISPEEVLESEETEIPTPMPEEILEPTPEETPLPEPTPEETPEPTETPIPEPTNLPSVNRDGFVMPDVDYSYMYDTNVDLDARPIDRETGEMGLSVRECAYEALRTLYDLIGYVPSGTVYMVGYVYEDILHIYFSHSASDPGHGHGFYSVSVTRYDGQCRYIALTYNCQSENSQVTYGIDPSQIAVPELLDQMEYDEIALWYYENSSYSDRRPVIRTETSRAYDEVKVTLYLEDESFHEFYFRDIHGRIPDGFYGPYPEGFEH